VVTGADSRNERTELPRAQTHAREVQNLEGVAIHVQHVAQLERFAVVLAAVGGQSQCRQTRCLHRVEYEFERVENHEIEIQIENLERGERPDALRQKRDVPAPDALFGKLKRAQVAAEREHVKQMQQMHFCQLVRMHLQCPQVHESKLLEVTELQLDAVHTQRVFETSYLETQLQAVHVL
jgi:hypothetical protein